jgi:ribosomal protein L32
MTLRAVPLTTAPIRPTPILRSRVAPLLLPRASQRSRFYRNFSYLALPLLPAEALSLNISSLLSDIWDSILRAVPKKKTSYMKKRHRQMAGKALKDVISLNTCSGCGKPKRAHVLCPDCVKGKNY